MKNRLLTLLPVLALSGWLSGCATAPPPATVAPQMFADALFQPGTDPISATQVFALSPAMKQYVDKEIATARRNKGDRQGLLDALYTKGQLQLEYDSSLTRTAAQAFDARSGNCLSLMIMTAAFAKYLELPVRYQNVSVDESWTRTGDLFYVSGHVNLTMGRRSANFLDTTPDELVVDFLPAAQLKGLRMRPISEQTVVAMYMNNRAVENLFDNRVDQAYWWARAALLEDPTLMTAYNTLGVIYRRHGQPAQAERVLSHVLTQEPDNTQALSNLVLLMKMQGRGEEERMLGARLLALQPHPPYQYFDLGMQAMQRGDYQAARDLFGKEVARSAFVHEFHFWLAQADYALGDLPAARKQMALAVEHSTSTQSRQQYSAKLEWLKARGAAR